MNLASQNPSQPPATDPATAHTSLLRAQRLPWLICAAAVIVGLLVMLGPFGLPGGRDHLPIAAKEQDRFFSAALIQPLVPELLLVRTDREKRRKSRSSAATTYHYHYANPALEVPYDFRSELHEAKDLPTARKLYAQFAEQQAREIALADGKWDAVPPDVRSFDAQTYVRQDGAFASSHRVVMRQRNRVLVVAVDDLPVSAWDQWFQVAHRFLERLPDP